MDWKTEGPYRVDVKVSGENNWASNALRFDTPEEAKSYALDLAGRWFAMDMARVVEVEVPERESVDPSDQRIVFGAGV